MELLKDYDCEILNHPDKANDVVDALSRKDPTICVISAPMRILSRLSDMI